MTPDPLNSPAKIVLTPDPFESPFLPVSELVRGWTLHL